MILKLTMNNEQKIATLTTSAGLINRYIFDRSVVIAAHNEKDPFDHGTGMLLSLEEANVVITAAHVIDKYGPDQLQIVSAENASNIKNAPSGKEFVGGKKFGQADVGFLQLSDDSITKLDHKKFLTLDDLEIFPQGLAEDMAVIFGMPEELHKTEQGNVHRYESFSYYSNIPADFDWTSKKQRPVQVVMEYPENVEDAFSKMFADLPEPSGMSGGGIWRARFKGSLIWTTDRLRLIGINAEFYRKKRSVKANRIEALVTLLAKHFPSADTYFRLGLKALQESQGG